MNVTKNRVEIKMGSGSNAVPLESRYEFFESDGLCVNLDPAILYHLLAVLCDDYQRSRKKKPTLSCVLKLLQKQRKSSIEKNRELINLTDPYRLD